VRFQVVKQGVLRDIQFIETDNNRNIDRYPGKSDDNPRTPRPSQIGDPDAGVGLL
jgi:hypothetical protein